MTTADWFRLVNLVFAAITAGGFVMVLVALVPAKARLSGPAAESTN